MTQPLSNPQKRGNSVPFHSILFDESEAGTDIGGREAPEFFTDLNLDQIVASMTAGRDEYNLKPFFYTPLSRVETINYRYDIQIRSARVLHRPESRPDCCVHDGRPRRIQLKTLLLHPVEPCRDHQLSLRHTDQKRPSSSPT